MKSRLHPLPPTFDNCAIDRPFLYTADIGPGWQNSPGDLDDRDLRFVDALLQKLRTTYQVDERRVYAVGVHSGAQFTGVLVAARPERFAAFAMVGMFSFPGLDRAQVPRPALIIQSKLEGLSQGEWARNQIRRLNGCGTSEVEWTTVGAGGLTAISYQPCASGQPVILARNQSVNFWPRDASSAIVAFFQAHRVPDITTTAEPLRAPDASLAVVGSGKRGFSGDGGPALAAELDYPSAVAVDANGGLLIVDCRNHRVRRVDPQGIITTVAGSGFIGSSRASRATSAQFTFPQGIAADRSGGFFVVDTANSLVRQVGPDGSFHAVAGIDPPDFQFIRATGDGGSAKRARLSYPLAATVDADGSLLIADTENHRVRKVGLDGIITTVVGTGTEGFAGDNGPALAAQLNAPSGLALDRDGNLYIADTENHRVRKVARDGTITTVAGTGTRGFSGDGGPASRAELNKPTGLAVDTQGNLFLTDLLNDRVRRVAPDGTITTIFGETAEHQPAGYYPAGIAIDRQGNLLIADPVNERIWKVPGVAAPGLLAGQPFPGAG